jgi:hypothetical protein
VLGGREGGWEVGGGKGGGAGGGGEVYPMDYYAKEGLGRVKAEDLAQSVVVGAAA